MANNQDTDEEVKRRIKQRRAEARKLIAANYEPAADLASADLKLSNSEILDKLQDNFPLAHFNHDAMINMMEELGYRMFDYTGLKFVWGIREK